MAKKSTKSVKTNNDAKILRNYDIFSIEKRVHDMDNSPIRSYDLFSLEKRIHDLEMGGAPGPTGDNIKFFNLNYFWDSRSTEPTPIDDDTLAVAVNEETSSWTCSAGFNIKIEDTDYTKVEFDITGTLTNYGAIQACTRDDIISGSIGSLVTQNQTKLINLNPNGGDPIIYNNEHITIEIPADHKKYFYLAACTGCNSEGTFSDIYNGSASVQIKNVRFS